MKKVTLEQIGIMCGVSKVAVYKALNDKPGISDTLREKIKDVAASLGYVPCNTKYKTNLKFAYLVSKDFFLTTAEQFYTAIYYYLNIECSKVDSTLEIIFFEKNTVTIDQLKASINCSGKNHYSGVFIAGDIKGDVLSQLGELKTPIVFIDFYSALYKYDYVYLDNYNLSYYATKHLIAAGHKTIGFIGDVKATSSICDRYLGYIKALLEQDLPIKEEWIIKQSIEKENNIENVLPETLPSAFVCHCDSAAHKLYLLLKLRNLVVPDDVSVISFDNTDICKSINPTLTSVGVSKEKYAIKSMEAMMNILNGTRHRSNTILHPFFAERNSVKKINTATEYTLNPSETEV